MTEGERVRVFTKMLPGYDRPESPPEIPACLAEVEPILVSDCGDWENPRTGKGISLTGTLRAEVEECYDYRPALRHALLATIDDHGFWCSESLWLDDFFLLYRGGLEAMLLARIRKAFDAEWENMIICGDGSDDAIENDLNMADLGNAMTPFREVRR